MKSRCLFAVCKLRACVRVCWMVGICNAYGSMFLRWRFSMMQSYQSIAFLPYQCEHYAYMNMIVQIYKYDTLDLTSLPFHHRRNAITISHHSRSAHAVLSTSLSTSVSRPIIAWITSICNLDLSPHFWLFLVKTEWITDLPKWILQ